MAKRAPDTAPKNRWIFTLSSICDLTSTTETRHGCGDGQDKSIPGPFDNTTFAGACHLDHPRTTLRGHGADNRQDPRAQNPRSVSAARRRGDRVSYAPALLPTLEDEN